MNRAKKRERVHLAAALVARGDLNARAFAVYAGAAGSAVVTLGTRALGTGVSVHSGTRRPLGASGGASSALSALSGPSVSTFARYVAGLFGVSIAGV